MTASTVDLVTVDLAETASSRLYTVLVAADLMLPDAVPEPEVIAGAGWTLAHSAEVWTDISPVLDIGGTDYWGRWRWAGVLTCTRTVSAGGVTVAAAQCVGHWDMHGPPTVETYPTPSGGVISPAGAFPNGWVSTGTDQWTRSESFAGAQVVSAPGGTVGPVQSANPIPVTIPGRDLGDGNVGGADGQRLIDTGAAHFVSLPGGSESGSIGTFYPVSAVLWTAGAGRTWTAGALDATDIEIGTTEVPVAWSFGRRTDIEFWEPWTPPTEPTAGGWHLGLPFGGATGWHVSG